MAGAASGLSESAAVRVLGSLRLHEGLAFGETLRNKRYENNLMLASEKNKLLIVAWWLTKYLLRSDLPIQKTMQIAINMNCIPVLEWMEKERILGGCW